MAERTLCKLADAYLDEIPRCWYYNVKDIYTSGLPDRIGCIEGIFWAAELKDRGKKARKLQAWVISRIRVAGGNAICTDDFDEFKQFIEQLRVNAVRARGRIL